MQLGRPLAVPPVADPDQVALALDLRPRLEDGDVRGLVPDPDPVGPPPLQVLLAHGTPEGEDAVVAVEVVGGQARRLRHRAVVGVVEEQRIAAVAPAVPAQAAHQLGRVPLVDQHQVGAVQGAVEVERRQVVEMAREVRIDAAEAGERRLAPLLREQVGAAPAVARLLDLDAVPALPQGPAIAAQEVGVAVVPVRLQRVAEEDDVERRTAHTAAPPTTTSGTRGSAGAAGRWTVGEASWRSHWSRRVTPCRTPTSGRQPVSRWSRRVSET